MSLRAGGADDKRWVRPSGHIWTKSAQSWVKFAEDDLTFEGQPADYGPLAARYASFSLFSG